MKQEWISVHDELPPLGKRVYVKGAHVPKNTAFPIAYRRMDGLSWRWESMEWRGTVAITHWKKIPKGMMP